MPLEHSDLLSLIGQLAAAFVGLSTAVALLQPHGSTSAARVQSMRAVTGSGLLAGGGAVLALMLHAFDLSSEWVWRVSSVAVSASWLTLFGFAARRFRRAEASASTSPRAAPPFILIPVVPLANLLLWWNIAVPSGSAGARYTTALFLALVISVERFVAAAFQVNQVEPTGS